MNTDVRENRMYCTDSKKINADATTDKMVLFALLKENGFKHIRKPKIPFYICDNSIKFYFRKGRTLVVFDYINIQVYHRDSANPKFGKPCVYLVDFVVELKLKVILPDVLYRRKKNKGYLQECVFDGFVTKNVISIKDPKSSQEAVLTTEEFFRWYSPLIP